MLPIVSILVIVGLSLLVTRVASVALVHTGLGREAARFQARSAFTGVPIGCLYLLDTRFFSLVLNEKDLT